MNSSIYRNSTDDELITEAFASHDELAMELALRMENRLTYDEHFEVTNKMDTAYAELSDECDGLRDKIELLEPRVNELVALVEEYKDRIARLTMGVEWHGPR